MGQKNLTEIKFKVHSKYDYSKVPNIKAQHQNTLFPKNANLYQKESKSMGKDEEQKIVVQKAEEINPTRIPGKNYDQTYMDLIYIKTLRKI